MGAWAKLREKIKTYYPGEKNHERPLPQGKKINEQSLLRENITAVSCGTGTKINEQILPQK